MLNVAVCEDERDCTWVIEQHKDKPEELAEYCVRYKDDPEVKQCKKTCGYCKFENATRYLAHANLTLENDCAQILRG